MDIKDKTFDLHIHTRISDGALAPEHAAPMLRQHADFVTVTDHDDPSYHRRKDTGCSFTGMEITSDITLHGKTMLAEMLFYGFERSDIDQLMLMEHDKFNMTLDELAQYLEPIKLRTGAKLLVAHPYCLLRTDVGFEEILDYCSGFVDGFECLHYSARRENEVRFLLEYCKRNGKIASGGSDSHGLLKATPYLHLVDEYLELFQWIPELANST